MQLLRNLRLGLALMSSFGLADGYATDYFDHANQADHADRANQGHGPSACAWVLANQTMILTVLQQPVSYFAGPYLVRTVLDAAGDTLVVRSSGPYGGVRWESAASGVRKTLLSATGRPIVGDRERSIGIIEAQAFASQLVAREPTLAGFFAKKRTYPTPLMLPFEPLSLEDRRSPDAHDFWFAHGKSLAQLWAERRQGERRIDGAKLVHHLSRVLLDFRKIRPAGYGELTPYDIFVVPGHEDRAELLPPAMIEVARPYMGERVVSIEYNPACFSGERADVFSLGVILYRHIVEMPPFRAKNAVIFGDTVFRSLCSTETAFKESALHFFIDNVARIALWSHTHQDLENIVMSCLLKPSYGLQELRNDLGLWLAKRPAGAF